MANYSLDEVIEDLNKIVAECQAKKSALGFFASLYRRVTIRVRDGIARGEFEDNARMEKLDVLFAKRYIDAYNAYQADAETTQSWMIPFVAANKPKLLIMQHLLLGMNAHINLDLGIAAAQTVGHAPIEGLKNDFNQINALLAELIDDVQDRIGQVSPLFNTLDPLTGRLDENLAAFSINVARDGAWAFAKAFHATSPANQNAAIANRDFKIARLAQALAAPKNRWMKTVIRIVRLFETKNVNRVMDALD